MLTHIPGLGPIETDPLIYMQSRSQLQPHLPFDNPAKHNLLVRVTALKRAVNWFQMMYCRTQGRIAPCSGLQPQYMCQSLRPHAGTPHMESCRKLVSPAKRGR